MAQKYIFTQAELDRLKAELDHLSVTGRQEAAERLQVARSYGDLSENAEYDAAKEDQGKLETRISELEFYIANATIIDEASISTEIVGAGAKVTIKDDEFGDVVNLEIISSAGGSSSDGSDDFSIQDDESPVARALIGHRVGDVVEVEAPCGVVKYTILGITR